MKKLLVAIALFISMQINAQTVEIDSTSFIAKHGELTFYLDRDTNTFVSVHKVSYSNITHITGDRSDKWHTEPPKGPYVHKNAYVHSNYDLGHLTPSNITSYTDTTNYNSFSLFNQAPQLSYFNRGKWAQLEKQVVKQIKDSGKDAVVITGVIYNNKDKKYLQGSRIKIPAFYYKILVIEKNTFVWIGDNTNGEIKNSTIGEVLSLGRSLKNHIDIKIK